MNMPFSPELLQAVLSMGGQSAQLDPQIAQQQQMALAMKQRSGTPQMRNPRGIPVAASPLEHVASVMGGAMGGMQDREVSSMQQQQASMRQAQTQRILEALLQQQPQAPQQGTGLPASGQDPYANMRMPMGT